MTKTGKIVDAGEFNFVTQTKMHLDHWASKRYGEHVALGEFYNYVIKSIDEIVEVYQGCNGLIDAVKIPPFSIDQIADHLSREAEWIEKNRDTISEGNGTVGALIDDLVAIYYRTVYKLKNLK